MTDLFKWIETLEIDNGNLKTRLWEIRAKRSGHLLGYVRWYSPWRKYAFLPVPTSVFEEDCLHDIAEHLEMATAGHKGEI